MATLTLEDYEVPTGWSDVVATHAILGSAAAIFQCVSTTNVQIVFGGASAPVDKTGIVLSLHDSVRGDAANVWVRALGPQSALSVTLV